MFKYKLVLNVHFMTFGYLKSQACYWKNLNWKKFCWGVPAFPARLERSVLICALSDVNRVRLCAGGCFTLDYNILAQWEFPTVGLCSPLCLICTVGKCQE